METETLFVIDYIADGEYGLYEVDVENQDSILHDSSEEIGDLIAQSQAGSTVFMSETVREIYNMSKSLIEKEDALKLFMQELAREIIAFYDEEYEDEDEDEDGYYDDEEDHEDEAEQIED